MATVQGAFRVLVKQGLVIRQQKLGTFVRHEETLKNKKILFFYPRLRSEIQEASINLHRIEQIFQKILQEKNYILETWMPIVESYSEVKQELVQIASRRSIEGILVNQPSQELYDILQGLPVPVAILSSKHTPLSVTFDHFQGGSLAVKSFVDSSIREIGLLCDIDPQADSTSKLFYEGVRSTLKKEKIIIHSDWICSPPKDFYPRHSHMAIAYRYSLLGYQMMDQLLKTKKIPKGLIVMTEYLIPGVIQALARHEVNLEKSLRLLVHQTPENPVFYSLPGSILSSSMVDVVTAAVDKIIRESSGERVGFVKVPYTIQKNQLMKKSL